MKKIVAFILLPFLVLGYLWAAPAQAVQCSTKVCIKVFTDPKTGQVIIQAVQNKAGSTPKPKPTRTWKPRPYTPRPYTPRPKVVRTYKPKPKSAVSIKPKIIAAVSLSDRLSKLIPMREIYYQPTSKVLTQVPVNFWTTTNPVFTTSVVILGIPVSVNLNPTYQWDFGDGSSLTTKDRGAAYPNGKILHTYKTQGSYIANLTISWAGTWMADKLTYPVLGGDIVQHLTVPLTVAPAPTKYLR